VTVEARIAELEHWHALYDAGEDPDSPRWRTLSPWIGAPPPRRPSCPATAKLVRERYRRRRWQAAGEKAA